MGVYPTIDLLKHRPEKVLKVFIHPDAEGNRLEDIHGMCKKNDIHIEYNAMVIEKLAVKGNTYVMGVFEKYEEELSKEKNHVVLVEPRNLGNIGTIVRTMAGFGFEDLAIIRPAADVWDPMVVRSAMGSLFQTRFKHFDTYEEYIKEYEGHNQYLFMLDGAQEVKDVKFEGPYSIVQGNESKGLPDHFKEHGTSVYIPHADNIDSLNLSIATAISLYEVSSR